MNIKLKAVFPPLKHLFNLGFLSSQNIFISLDIGSAYIKAVSLEKSNQNIVITGFSYENIEANIKDAIKKTISNLGAVKKRELALSVSGQGVLLRYINMPIMSYEETTKAMDFELEKHIPFKKDQINFDFTILKKNKNTGKMLVLIAAAKKELIDNNISMCQELGYNLKFIDTGPLAIANYLEFVKNTKKEESCAVINIGASMSFLDIIEDGLLVLSRDVFIGGNDFTKKISEVFNKSFKEAEDMKLKSSDNNLILALEPILNNLIGELKISFDFYETKENRSIDKILITGGSVQLKGLPEFLKHSLGQDIELIILDSDKLKLGSALNYEEFKKNFNYFTVALGLALR